MTLSLRKIEEAAKAATPGPGQSAYTHPRDDNNWEANQRFTEMMDADTVLALVAVVRAARAVGYSNGFDAAYPEKLAALREALKGIEP